MRRLRLFLTGSLAFIVALNASILPTPAVPPIIRLPSAELPSAIADDFTISQQTPYNSGRNEVVVTSPSTNTVQRFWLSLPGEPFQLYELALSNVAVNNADSLISAVEAQTSPAEVQQRLKSFKAIFDNNTLAEIELADGTKATFSPQEVTITQPNGRVSEVIKREQGHGKEGHDKANSAKDIDWRNKSGQQIAKGDSCEQNTAREIAKESTDIKAWSKDIAAGWSPNIDWQDALATRLIREAAAALAYTLQEATSSSVALQKTTCKAPVQCGFRRDTKKEGISGNQIITDLFRVPVGATGKFNLDYEFFKVPDRLEISYNGEIKRAFGPTDGRGSESFSLSDVEEGFVGIRVIGNPDEDTEWWYEINCYPALIASVPRDPIKGNASGSGYGPHEGREDNDFRSRSFSNNERINDLDDEAREEIHDLIDDVRENAGIEESSPIENLSLEDSRKLEKELIKILRRGIRLGGTLGELLVDLFTDWAKTSQNDRVFSRPEFHDMRFESQTLTGLSANTLQYGPNSNLSRKIASTRKFRKVRNLALENIRQKIREGVKPTDIWLDHEQFRTLDRIGDNLVEYNIGGIQGRALYIDREDHANNQHDFKVIFVFYDDFGVDKADMEPWLSGLRELGTLFSPGFKGMKAQWLLQHYFSGVPFVQEIVIEQDFSE